jgi:hypothetical protein
MDAKAAAVKRRIRLTAANLKNIPDASFPRKMRQLLENAANIEKNAMPGSHLAQGELASAIVIRNEISTRLDRMLGDPSIAQQMSLDGILSAALENQYRLLRDIQALYYVGRPTSLSTYEAVFRGIMSGDAHSGEIKAMACNKKAQLWLSLAGYLLKNAGVSWDVKYRKEASFTAHFMTDDGADAAENFAREAVSLAESACCLRKEYAGGNATLAKAYALLAEILRAKAGKLSGREARQKNSDEIDCLLDSAAIRACLALELYANEVKDASYDRRNRIIGSKMPSVSQLLELIAPSEVYKNAAKKFKETIAELSKKYPDYGE